MSSILKVDQLQDSGGNALITSDGSGNLTTQKLLYPAFYVKKTSAQNITNNTYTQVTFDTENIDTDNVFDSNKFTVPTGKGGKYFLYTQVWADSNAASNLEYCNIAFYKNNSQIKNNIYDFRNNPALQFVCANSLIIDLAEGDNIKIYARISDLSGTPTVMGDASDLTNFGGYRIGD